MFRFLNPFHHLASNRQVAELRFIIINFKEIVMTKLEELQTEVAETKAASTAVLGLLGTTQASVADLQDKLAEALAANDGEATNAKIQEAIDGLNEVQSQLSAALPVEETPDPETPVDPDAPTEDGALR